MEVRQPVKQTVKNKDKQRKLDRQQNTETE